MGLFTPFEYLKGGGDKEVLRRAFSSSRAEQMDTRGAGDLYLVKDAGVALGQ
jgi:hypothetical protein